MTERKKEKRGERERIGEEGEIGLPLLFMKSMVNQ